MSLIKKFLLALRFIGWSGIFRSVMYAWRRDRVAARVSSDPGTARLRPERRVAFEEALNGGYFTFENGLTLRVDIEQADAVCMTWQPGALPYTSYGFKNEKSRQISSMEDMATRINIVQDNTGAQRVVFSTAEFSLTVDGAGGVRLHDPSGSLLASAEPPTLEAGAWTLRAPLAPNEHIYGLGQRASGLNLAGRCYTLWNTSPGGAYGEHTDPLYLTLPVYLGLHTNGSYLAFLENTHKGAIDFRDETLQATFAAGALKIHWMVGAPRKTLLRYTELTGRPGLPPRWSLGFHQCRWGYASEQDLRDVVRGFEEHALPLHAIHQDIDYMIGHRVFTVDPSRYPDLPGLVQHMAMRNIRLAAILDPGIKVDPDYPVYQSGLRHHHYIQDPRFDRPIHAPVWPGWCAFPDFTDARTRRWWADQYPALLSQGVAGIWHDMNEPETFAAWGDPALPETARHSFDGRSGTHLEARNIYGLLMNQAGFEAHRRHRPDQRPWLLSRSGWAGSQRYAWHWTADIDSSWEALRVSVFMLINLGLSGFAFSGTDIGGFSGNPDAELYTRWFQLAAFHPFFRNHAARGTQPREPWVYGEPTTTIVRNFLQLRERLIPYLYTLSAEAAETGAPLVRPLFWAHPEREELWDADDSFLLGSDLLIVPVLSPGQKTMVFATPPGGWYDLWSGTLLPPERPITTTITLDTIPLYVRAGAILPLEAGPRSLELHVYPDETGRAEGSLYFDEGDGYGVSGMLHLQLHGGETAISANVLGNAPLPWDDFKLIGHGEFSRANLRLQINQDRGTG